ncbi:hypothetical protein [Candidatus Spongiihabitans sp.]|uniref:hypothetical protein n=1 Tax=Candidatus Spongiihabitans sp. TaxID=3101308 RepID=UPI003C7E0B11
MSPQLVIARLVPGNPVIKPFGVAELLCFDAAPFNARMTARRWCLLLTCMSASRRLRHSGFARIIPDTRPSGSLRSRPVDSWRSRRFFPPAGENDRLGRQW